MVIADAASLYENNDTTIGKKTDFTELTQQEDSAYKAELHLIEKKVLLQKVYQDNSLDKNIEKTDKKTNLARGFLGDIEAHNLFEKKIPWQESKKTSNPFYKNDFFLKEFFSNLRDKDFTLKSNTEYVDKHNEFERDTSVSYAMTDKTIEMRDDFSLEKIVHILSDLLDEYFGFIIAVSVILSLWSLISRLIHMMNRRAR